MGCKVPFLPLLLLSWITFYLNYVGCKVAVAWLCLMDVGEFYLNYVGCKDTQVSLAH